MLLFAADLRYLCYFNLCFDCVSSRHKASDSSSSFPPANTWSTPASHEFAPILLITAVISALIWRYLIETLLLFLYCFNFGIPTFLWKFDNATFLHPIPRSHLDRKSSFPKFFILRRHFDRTSSSCCSVSRPFWSSLIPRRFSEKFDTVTFFYWFRRSIFSRQNPSNVFLPIASCHWLSSW